MDKLIYLSCIDSMRLLQVTNIISHHQLPLARCLASCVGEDNFRYVTTQMPDKERCDLGWKSEEKDPWILRAGENKADKDSFELWWNEADVVLCGDRLPVRMKDRIDKGRLTFYMSERWWKPPLGMARLLYPRFAKMSLRFRKLALSPFFHYLPIGDYSAADMKRIASFQGRMWRWGYYTTPPNPLPECSRDDHEFRVLWAGRMLKWKRVDTLIKAFSRLLYERPDATLTLVGDGPERIKLEKLAGKLIATGRCRFLPPRPTSEILEMMRQQHVYVLSSNAYEGWGAVVNEAMSEGCLVIASEEAGAAKSMIAHLENGLLFKSGAWKQLTEHLLAVGRDSNLLLRLAREGQRTVTECWSPEVAAERFLSVCDALLGNDTIQVFSAGPMSPV